MRYAKALLPTQKEAPADATAKSHILLTRAGYMRKVGSGIYSYLPLGLRVLRRIETIVREEMDKAGCQEILLPMVIPAEYFKESGRWDSFGDTLFRLKDRREADLHLGPTHEEVITDLARREINSYRDLPKNLYQVQTKFRDETRPRGGLLRGREFLMKDAYSFDATEEGALASYEKMRVAYRRIFDRLGFDYRMVGADSGAMGGSKSAEFQVLVHSGEDFIATCSSCDYAENLEVASPPLPENVKLGEIPASEKVETPQKRTIAEVSQFLSTEPAQILKSLVYVSGEEKILAVVRGDHEVNELKLARAAGVTELRLGNKEDTKRATGAALGFAGPVGFKGRVFIDAEAAAVEDAVVGANQTDFHLKHVQHGRDFEAEVLSLREMTEGDPCPLCGDKVKLFRGIEAGHIFVLGTHYSKKMNAVYLDAQGEKNALVMGCYGIGISRLVASLVEQHHDDGGIRWPLSAAPYPVHICQMGESDAVKDAVAKLESELTNAGFEPLVDDRDVRPGVKFKDADLIGIPYRVTIGERALADGQVEMKARSESNPKSAEMLPLDSVASTLVERLRQELSSK